MKASKISGYLSLIEIWEMVSQGCAFKQIMGLRQQGRSRL